MMRALPQLLALNFLSFAAAQPCASFKVYWALTGPSTADPASPPLDNSTAGAPYLFEPAAQFFLKRRPAAAVLPFCVTQPDGSILAANGGVPQNATATAAAFLRALQAELAGDVPANWTGAGAFDLPFPPDLSFPGSDPCVAALSSALVRAAHPGWNASQVQAEAAAQFNNASWSFYATALQAGRAAASKARWGFLGFPLSLAGPCKNAGLDPMCGYHHPVAGAAQKAVNSGDHVSHILDFSGAVFPTIELSLGQGGGEWANRNKDAIYGVVEQARRGNNFVGWSVLPVLRARYADAPAAELLPEDLDLALAAVVQAGGNGLVVMGDPFADAPAKAGGFSAYLAATLGPAVRAAVSGNCACAVESCSDGGNCVGLRYRPAFNDTLPACFCRNAFHGDTCNASGAAAAEARAPPPAAPPLRPVPLGASAARGAGYGGAAAPPPPSPGCPSVPPAALFQQFWNIVDQATANRSGPVLDNSSLADAYLFTAGNQTRTGAVGGDYMPTCRSFFNKTANETQIQSFNGGIPQLANLTQLFDAVRDEIAGNFTSPNCHPTPEAPCRESGWGLQPDFEGNAVFDFEAWRPVFAGQWNDECMTNLSVAKVMQENPSWTNRTQIYAQAELEFEDAAMGIFVGMIDIGKTIAPRGKWGFYGYPANLFYYCINQGDDPQCGYHNDYLGGSTQKWFNDNKYQKVRSQVLRGLVVLVSESSPLLYSLHPPRLLSTRSCGRPARDSSPPCT